MARKAEYRVIIDRYASDAARERFEQGGVTMDDIVSMQSEFIYSGPSRARASAAFFRAAQLAQHDELVRNIVVMAGHDVIIRLRPVNL
jgi:hypothetical protein